MEERTLKLAQDHIALLTESFEARGVYVSELHAQIAILTAERNAALDRFRENADMKHFVELWEQDQIDYGAAIERAEKAEKELDAALARERELVDTVRDLDGQLTKYPPSRLRVILDKSYDADGNWKGEVE